MQPSQQFVTDKLVADLSVSTNAFGKRRQVTRKTNWQGRSIDN